MPSNVDTLVASLREGTSPQMITRGILHAPDQGKWHVAGGELSAQNEHYVFTLRLRRGQPPPEIPRGVVTRKNAWSLKLLLNDSTSVFVPDVYLSSVTHSQPNAAVKLHGVRIHLVPEGTDRMTGAQIRRWLEQSNPTQAVVPSEPRKARSFEFHAILAKYPQIFRNAGTETKRTNPFLGDVGSSRNSDTYIDSTADLDFALIEKDGDLHVWARSRSNCRSRNSSADNRLFDGLLTAVGFTHGIHPWPWRRSYRLNHRLRDDILRTPQSLLQSHYLPLHKGWCFGVNQSDPRNGTGAALRLTAEFFARETPLAKSLSQMLFLFREATSSEANFDLGTHALCAVLEGIVDSLAARAENEASERFNVAKDRAIELLAQLPEDLKQERNRLIGRVRSMDFFDINSKFQFVCRNLDLRWEGLMQEHFAAWKKARNPAAHGNLMSQGYDVFQAQALIAGAINLLVLRAVGYRGLAMRSPYGALDGKPCSVQL